MAPQMKAVMFTIRQKGLPDQYAPFASREIEDEIIARMVDDFEKAFPWLIPHGHGPNFSFHTYRAVLSFEPDDRDSEKLTHGSFHNMPYELLYTLLKLTGHDMTRYGLEEVWEEEKDRRIVKVQYG